MRCIERKGSKKTKQEILSEKLKILEKALKARPKPRYDEWDYYSMNEIYSDNYYNTHFPLI